MKTNLLKEAIADADAVKKLAIENAKASLNEAFDSKIKSMLAARLEEEADEMEETYEEDDVEKAEKMEEKKHDEPSHSEEEKMDDKDADEAFDIDAILAEMEKEMGDEEEGADEAYGSDDEEMKEAKKDDSDEEVDEAKHSEDEEPKEEEEEPVDEEINIEALLAELAEEDDDEAYHGDDKSMDEKKEEEEDEKDEVKSLEEEMMSLLEKMKHAKAAKKEKEMKKEKPEVEELQEIKRQAAELAQKVNETNLINAKLLYLNKILRKYNLSEQQKIKVIGAFDKAGTVNEAKIVHESLDQAFSVKNDNVKAGLKESIGFASSSAGTSTKRVIAEEVIANADAQVSRWQKLAGIVK